PAHLLSRRARSNLFPDAVSGSLLASSARFFQHESEVCLVEKFEAGLAVGSGRFCVGSGPLVTRRVAVAGHTARRSKGAVPLAIGFKGGIRQKGRRRCAVHVRLFLKVSIRIGSRL